MIVRFNNQTTCQVNQHNRDISAHQGRYIDLKQYPERANELPEAKEWPALGAFVEAVNRCRTFRTSGCTASGATEGGHDAPFVDIAFADSLVQLSPAAYRQLSNELLELDGSDVAGDFVVELCDCNATLPDRKTILSLRLWLLGDRKLAPEVFKALLTLLARQETDEYRAVAEQDHQQMKKERRRAIIFLVPFLMLWIGFGCAGATLAGDQFGWLAGIGGFIGGIVLFPVLALLCLVLWLKMRS